MSGPSVFELEADGYTHISCHCSGCGHTTQIPFRLLRRQARFVITLMTLEKLGEKLACKRCPDRRRPTTCEPWRQADHGYTLPGAHRGNGMWQRKLPLGRRAS